MSNMNRRVYAAPGPPHTTGVVNRAACNTAQCVRDACCASEMNFSEFCCRKCAETQGLRHSPGCDGNWAFMRTLHLTPPPDEPPPGPDQIQPDEKMLTYTLREAEAGIRMMMLSRTTLHVFDWGKTAAGEEFVFAMMIVPKKATMNLTLQDSRPL